MKEQSNIEKTVSRSQFCSVNNLSLLSPTLVKPINFCLISQLESFSTCSPETSESFYSRPPFICHANGGVVTLQQRNASEQQQNLLTPISP